MCGIVAVAGRNPDRLPPTVAEVAGLLEQSRVALGRPLAWRDRLDAAVEPAARADALLRGVPGVIALVRSPELVALVRGFVHQVEPVLATIEAELEQAETGLSPRELEATNASLIAAKDVVWALHNDRLRTAVAVADLVGRDAGDAGLAGAFAIQVVLSSLDRLEVRGRDSAGIHVLVQGHGLDLAEPLLARSLAPRLGDSLFTSGAARTPEGFLTFVYKAAAEIGELGDNTRALRLAIVADDVLQRALRSPSARVTVLAHTRWASVGIISEPNAHPVIHEEDGRVAAGPYVAAALNGDVDNHADLKAEYGLAIAPQITTDAKVIPALVSRAAVVTGDLTEAFRRTVASFEGSVAIGAVSAATPDTVYLALRGSGQGLYVGLADGYYVVASEPYGLIEETSRYIRMDGETPARPEAPTASRGQVLVIDGLQGGSLAGVRRLAYDGTEMPVGADDVHVAQVTTRDIDRGDSPHFLLKEITEAPVSFRKTIRGRIVAGPGGLLRANVGDLALPPALEARLRAGEIRRVVVLGQGTAAVAGRSMARVLDELTGGAVRVVETTATEFSGFGLTNDLTDTLVIAVSQSGTTTDTNRTVDLARQRGATVVGIVNRRNSELADKADGVLYTSDGRDVEMSVASTKAFYAQVAAGVLLACALAEALGVGDPQRRHELLVSFRDLPPRMEQVLALRTVIGDAARRFAPPRRHWAVVGSGPNVVAAAEVRIKLSELCYKSIACDITEDKKHIDLSSEPMILVCAAGLSGSTADDVAKEVAIYRAHKAAPIVIATEGDNRFRAALAVISVPETDPSMAFVLSAMVGHLFGYEAALAIDALARPFREGREAIEAVVSADLSGDALLADLGERLEPVLRRFTDGLRVGEYDGALEASTAVRIASLLRFGAGLVPLDLYSLEHGKVGTPAVLVDDLTAALTRGVEELTRPIDAIKHQAKTVTVGISRSDEALLGNRFVRAVLEAGVGRDHLTYRSLKVLADLDPVIESVGGWTRYRVHGNPEGAATIEVIDRSGIGRDVPSRVDRNPELRGTKRRVAIEREVLVATGRSDGRTFVLVPEVKGTDVVGLTLVHVRLADRLDAATVRGVLQGYRNRYSVLRDAVCETEPVFRDDLLGTVAVVDLLTEPVMALADRWRSSTAP